MVDIDLPTYISLEEAAERYNIPVESLRLAVENNFVRAVISDPASNSGESNPELDVAEDDVAEMAKRSAQTIPAFILFAEAVKRYDLPVDVLVKAINKGIVKAVHVRDEVKVSETDVAIVAAQIQKQTDNDELVSINEVSRRLGIQSSVVSLWQRYGWLPVVALGSRGAKLVSWQRAQALGRLHQERNGRGNRLIPKGQELPELQAH